MKRRDFLGLLGGAAAAWPVIAYAQQFERVRRAGVLISRDAEDDSDVQPRVAAFAQAMGALGWIEVRNLRLDTYLTSPTASEVRKRVVELVATAPDVVLTTGSTTLVPILQASHTIPVVFMSVVDPVGGGLIESLARPGGNATGFMQFDYSLTGKWLELLKQIAPATTHAAVIRDSSTASGIGQFAVIQSMAPSVGIDVAPINVRDAGEIERAVGAGFNW